MNSPDSKEIKDAENELEQLDNLEKDFRRVIQNLVADHSMDQFRSEYEKLYDVLVEAVQNNEKLINQCKQLNNTILANANKVSSILTLNENDQRTIAGLRHEFEKAWKMVEVSQDREIRSKEVIENLKVEVSNLARQVEQGGSSAMTQETTLDETADMIVVLKKEIHVQDAQIVKMKEEYKKTVDENNKYYAAINETHEDENQLNKEYKVEIDGSSKLAEDIDSTMLTLKDTKEEIIQMKKVSEEIDVQIKKQKKVNSKQNEELALQKHFIFSAEEDLNDRHRMVNETNQRLEEVKIKNTKIAENILKYEKDIKEVSVVIGSYQHQLNQIMEEIKESTSILNEEKSYKQSILKEKNEYFEKMNILRLDVLKQNSVTTASAINIHSRHFDIERENHHLKRIQSKFGEENQETNIISRQCGIFFNEILSLKNFAHNDRAKLSQYDEETKKYISQIEEVKSLKNQIDEESNSINLQNDTLQLKLSGLYQDLKHQDYLNEAIRSERDTSCRQVKETQKNVEEIKAENKALAQTVCTLKENIREKDQQCVQIHLKHKILARQNITLRRNVKQQVVELKDMDLHVTELRNKVQRVLFYLSEGELDTTKQKQMIYEIGSSSKQIERSGIQRMQEKDVLFEKVKLIKSLISKGKYAFQQQTNMIEEKKHELLYEVAKVQNLINKKRHSRALQLELIRIQKSIVEEAGKAKALEGEIEKPLNVHRWRFYDGTNSELALLIRMNVALRDKLMILISISERLIRNKKSLKEKCDIQEKHLQNSYGCNNYEDEYSYYVELLKSKTRMLSHMQHQASNQQAAMTENKEQLSTVRTLVREEKTEMKETRKKVVKIRSKTEMNKIRKPLQPRSGNEMRYVGGGFVVGGVKPTVTQQVQPVQRNKTALEEKVPGLIFPIKTPRRMDENNTARKKTIPKGWNPSRNPIRPFIPTALGTDLYY